MIDKCKWASALLSTVMVLTTAACKEQEHTAIDTTRDAVPPQINRTNTDVTDARNNPPPGVTSSATPSESVGTNASSASDANTSQDAYKTSRDAYKAALAKAEDDHKTALESCNALAKQARKSCKENADMRLKIAKSEAERLKPAS